MHRHCVCPWWTDFLSPRSRARDRRPNLTVETVSSPQDESVSQRSDSSTPSERARCHRVECLWWTLVHSCGGQAALAVAQAAMGTEYATQLGVSLLGLLAASPGQHDKLLPYAEVSLCFGAMQILSLAKGSSSASFLAPACPALMFVGCLSSAALFCELSIPDEKEQNAEVELPRAQEFKFADFGFDSTNEPASDQ